MSLLTYLIHHIGLWWWHLARRVGEYSGLQDINNWNEICPQFRTIWSWLLCPARQAHYKAWVGAVSARGTGDLCPTHWIIARLVYSVTHIYCHTQALLPTNCQAKHNCTQTWFAFAYKVFSWHHYYCCHHRHTLRQREEKGIFPRYKI